MDAALCERAMRERRRREPSRPARLPSSVYLIFSTTVQCRGLFGGVVGRGVAEPPNAHQSGLRPNVYRAAADLLLYRSLFLVFLSVAGPRVDRRQYAVVV